MSFAAKVEKLMFTVGLTDKTAGPVGRINARIDRLTQNAQKGFRNMAYGAAGMTGAVFMLNRAMAPAIEQQRALNEVSSLDVEPKALQKLNRMALQTQAQFGTASSQIVRSAYDIQSAISGLSGDELSRFTRNSAILAKGTKSDAGVITNYMGTMYGIFSENAEAMGKSKWVDQLTGQTAAAVKVFKTTGTAMQSAFGSLGAEGQAALRPMHEQMAVLGQLQATMSGSEAGTKYRAFLQNVGRAQKSLGLNFTDSTGRMLPMVDILNKIQGKYGQINTVAKSDIIQQAFGSEEAVALVKLLIKDTSKLGDNIDQLGQVKGLENAIKMANKMTDPWQQIAGTAKSVHTAFSQALMPVLQPTIEKMTEAGKTLVKWTELFPHLTKVLAVTGMAVLGLIFTIAALTVAVGIYRFMAVGWAVIHTLLTGGTWLLVGAVKGLTLAYKIARTSMMAFYLLSAVSGGAFAALKVILLSMTSSVWAFNAALFANPITWIVLGVVALGAAIAAAVIYWDDIKAAATTAIDWMRTKLAAFTDWMGSLNPFELLGEGIDWLIEKLNLIPGVNIETRFSGPPQPDALKNNNPVINPVQQKLAEEYSQYSVMRGQQNINTQTSAVVPLRVQRQLAANEPTLKPVNFAPETAVVPLNVQRDLRVSEPTLKPVRFSPQNTAVPLAVQKRLQHKRQPDLQRSESVKPLNTVQADLPRGGINQQLRQHSSDARPMNIEHVTIRSERPGDPEDWRQQILLEAM